MTLLSLGHFANLLEFDCYKQFKYSPLCISALNRTTLADRVAGVAYRNLLRNLYIIALMLCSARFDDLLFFIIRLLEV